MTEMDGQIILVETSSLAMKLNGMILMEMVMVTTGTIQNGILREIQIGQGNLTLPLHFRTDVQIHHLQTSMKKDVPRVNEIQTVMV